MFTMLRHHQKLHYYRYCRHYAATIIKLHASYVFFLWQDKSGYDRFLISVVKREEFLQINNPFSKWDWIEYKCDLTCYSSFFIYFVMFAK